MEQWLIIGISGVTCSGKTTLAQSLSTYFKEQVGNEIKAGIIVGRVEKIHQDAYFYPMDDPRHKMVEEFHHPNKEIIESLDMDEMVNDIKGILGDDFVLYDTRSSGLEVTNRQNRFAMKQVKDSQNGFENSNMIHLNILIIEGFLVYNHPWTLDICNVKYHLQLPFESCYARRVKRFYKVPDLPHYFERVVWPAYGDNYREFQDRKDVILLDGEMTQEKCFQFVLNELIDEL